MVYCNLNSIMGGECREPRRAGDVTKCQETGLLLLLQEIKGIVKELSAKAKRVAKERKK